MIDILKLIKMELPTATDIVKAIREAEYRGYMKAVEERPQGKWIKDENGDCRCSECGGCEEQFIYGTENWYGRGESKFCPSCGARMKGADDETD